MSGVTGRVTGFGRFLQSDIVLRIARAFYLLTACACLAGVLLGVLVAVLAQASTMRSAHQDAVPAVRAAQTQPIAVSDVEARLAPPSNVRFVADLLPSDAQLQAGQVVGRFEASTPNGLANYPNDFDIIGGRDAALFALAPYPGNRSRTALIATAALAQQVNTARAAAAPQPAQYSVRAIARDSFGANSPPTDVSFALAFGVISAPAAEPAAAPTSLEALAREIALAIDPSRSDVYFDAQRRALQEPRRCGAGQSSDFVAQYRRAFDQVHARLTPANAELFFIGVCEAWSNAVARGAAISAQDAAAAEAVEMRNLEARMSVEGQKALAIIVRNVAIATIIGAFACFLTVALFLAFLAMEGHSRALRDAVDALAVHTGAKTE